MYNVLSLSNLIITVEKTYVFNALVTVVPRPRRCCA